MAWLNELPGMGAAEDRAAKALSFPVGAASPLWFAFGAAASAGVAWWWATRWARPVNLEALFATPQTTPKPVPTAVVHELFPKLEPVPEPVAEPVVVLEVVPEFVVEPVVELVPAPIPEPVVEAAPEPIPEPAPAPVVVAAAAPKPKPVPAPPPEPLVPDDLTQIVGIGPKLAAALAERGVVQYAQLAKWTGKDLEKIDKALNLKGRAIRDAWVAQAKRFAGA
ncbi:MAG TPA: hypothetical protein VF459_17485 [Caulobacteraceae bacterium]